MFEKDILTEKERQAVKDLLNSPLDFPNRFKQWFIDYMAQNIPPIPIEQVQGYVKTRGYGGTHTPGAITIGGGWTDLGGPDFTGMAPGDYLMIWGMYCPNNVSSGVLYRMGPLIDSLAGSPSEDNACKVSAGSVGATGARARVVTVQDSLHFRYRAELWSGGPGSNAAVTSSWATAIRVS